MTGHTGPCADCMGVYTRLSEETANGSPLWTKTATKDGESQAFFLYYSKKVKCWAITSNKEDIAKNFCCMRTMSQNPRPDRCPADARWGYFDGLRNPRSDYDMVCTEVRAGD